MGERLDERIEFASLLGDPLTRLVMDSDGVTEDAMIALMDQLRRSLAARKIRAITGLVLARPMSA